MRDYILQRLLLVIPTLLGILTVNFFIVQLVPGGPVEQAIAQLTMPSLQLSSRLSHQADALQSDMSDADTTQTHLVSDAMEARLKAMYEFDKPWWQRYWRMLRSYAVFNLGKSYYRDEYVINIIAEKLPVSLSLGFWSTLLIYSVALPLGIRKAVYHQQRFDRFSSVLLLIASAIPTFLFAIIMIIFFAGGDYFTLLPLRGLTSDHFDTLTYYQQILDYLWHLILPVSAISIGSIATLCFLVKHSFLEELQKTYVHNARARGIGEQKILYGHIFRNALLIVIAGIPATIVEMFFTGSLLIEVIFSLDGLGLLGYDAIISRDYPVVFGSLYLFSLLGLIVNILCDLCYYLVDKRIHFQAQT